MCGCVVRHSLSSPLNRSHPPYTTLLPPPSTQQQALQWREEEGREGRAAGRSHPPTPHLPPFHGRSCQREGGGGGAALAAAGAGAGGGAGVGSGAGAGCRHWRWRWRLRSALALGAGADTGGAIATKSLMDGLLLKAKRVEEQGEGEEEAVEVVAVAERAEVKGMGKAMFKGADGKMVGVKNVLLVPNVAANLISVQRLQKSDMDTSSKGAKTYTARLGKRILWELHEDKDVYNEMWQIPVVPMPKERQVGASVTTKGEAVGSGVDANDGIKENESKKLYLGGTGKQCEHKESGEATKEQQKGEENLEEAAEEEYGESISEAMAKGPLDEVVMDVVGPLKLGASGAEYFLTIVDVYTHMTWVYVLSKKSDVDETVTTDWLPMVERQQDRLVKAIRTDRGGEFLSKDFSMWLKKNGIRHSLTMPYSSAMNGIAERANRTITETARGLLIEAGLPAYFWPDAVWTACVSKNRALNHVGADKLVPYVEWIGRKPKVDMLRVFGCMCMALVPKHLRHNKLGA
ncbi:unnamed protein product [Closterium sp. NIES-53]